MSFTFGEFDSDSLGLIATLRELPSVDGLQLETLEAVGTDGRVLGGTTRSGSSFTFDVILEGRSPEEAAAHREAIALALDPARGEQRLTFDAAPGWQWAGILSASIRWQRVTWDAGAGYKLRADVTFDALEAFGRPVVDEVWPFMETPWVERRRNIASGAPGTILGTRVDGVSFDGDTWYQFTATGTPGGMRHLMPAATSGARYTFAAEVANPGSTPVTLSRISWSDMDLQSVVLAPGERRVISATGAHDSLKFADVRANNGQTFLLRLSTLEAGAIAAPRPFDGDTRAPDEVTRYRWLGAPGASASVEESRTLAGGTVARRLGNARSYPTVEVEGKLTASQKVTVTVGDLVVDVSGPLQVGEVLRLDYEKFDFGRWVGPVKVASVVRGMSTLDRAEMWPGEDVKFKAVSTGSVTRATLIANSRRQ